MWFFMAIFIYEILWMVSALWRWLTDWNIVLLPWSPYILLLFLWFLFNNAEDAVAVRLLELTWHHALDLEKLWVCHLLQLHAKSKSTTVQSWMTQARSFFYPTGTKLKLMRKRENSFDSTPICFQLWLSFNRFFRIFNMAVIPLLNSIVNPRSRG